jgi:hypothetical protein
MYKVLKDSLPVYCSEKSYEGVGEIVRNMEDWDESTFYPNPPSTRIRLTFSTPYRVQLCMEDVASQVTDAQGNVSTVYTATPRMGTKWVVFDENLQKIKLSKYDQAVWEKEKQWHRCQEQKKLQMAVVWGQLDDDTQSQMELAMDYAKHRKNGDIVGFLGLLCDICNGSDDGGLSYHPFKAMVAIKSLNLFSSQDVSNVHYF